jgi:hypothetical protein
MCWNLAIESVDCEVNQSAFRAADTLRRHILFGIMHEAPPNLFEFFPCRSTMLFTCAECIGIEEASLGVQNSKLQS